MNLFRKRPSLEEQDRAMSNLIAEQRKRESVEIWRRGWCISEATCVLDEASPDKVIQMAERIYRWVYGSHLRGDDDDPAA